MIICHDRRQARGQRKRKAETKRWFFSQDGTRSLGGVRLQSSGGTSGDSAAEHDDVDGVLVAVKRSSLRF
jgi:hypothetical protein